MRAAGAPSAQARIPAAGFPQGDGGGCAMASAPRARSVSPMVASEPIHRVLIAGGGPAAIEAALTLRRRAAGRVTTTVLAPDSHFVARPMSVLTPFAAGGPERRSLASLV